MDKTVSLGATYTIGSYILPGEPLIQLGDLLESKVRLVIDRCEKIVDWVKSGELEIGVVETDTFDTSLVYTKWMEDEMVVCSKSPLGDSIGREELKHCHLLCNNEGSSERTLIDGFFHEHGLSYRVFHSLKQIDNATSAIQGIKWSRPNTKHPTITIVSQLAIEEELKRKELYSSRIYNSPLRRSFYFVYNENSPYIEAIINSLSLL